MKWLDLRKSKLLGVVLCLFLLGVWEFARLTLPFGLIDLLVWLMLGCIAGVLIWKPFSDWDERRMFPERLVKVVVDDSGFAVHFPDKPDAAVRFDELLAVEIVTTDLGPFTCDYFLCLIHEDGRIEIPMGAEGWFDAMQAVNRLPGFDEEAAGEANRSTEMAVFKCWSREGLAGPQALVHPE